MNRLTVLTVFGAVLVLPSSAAAGTFGELPFTPIPDRGPARCLGATGAPGGIATLGPFSRRESATDLLTVSGDGVQSRERIEIGRMFECATVSEAPGGAAVVAGVTVNADYETELRAVVRDPGGAFAAPVTLSRRGVEPVAAVGPAGDAVVAWAERAGRRRFRILAARRVPGGAFGEAQTLVTWTRDESEFPGVHLAAAVDAAGTASLAWSRELPSDDFDEHVEAATARRGDAFAVQRIASGVSSDEGPVLATAADGWTLIAFEDGRDGLPQVFERAPGGAFAAVVLSAPPERPSRTGVSIAIRDGGGAVVAWRYGRFDLSRGVEAVTREAGGAFGAVHRVATPPGGFYEGPEDDFALFTTFDPFSGPPQDAHTRRLDVAIAPDGRIALAWSAAAGRPPLRAETAHGATGRLDGTFDTPHALGAPMRDTSDVAALFLADGRAAVTWTDNSQGADGRLHVALDGATPAAEPGAPRLSLRAPRFQRLFASQSPRVIAGCDRRCDLRAAVIDPQGSRGDVVTWTRRRAGRRPLTAGSVDVVPRRGSRIVKVVVQASAPGGGRTTMRRVRIRVARRPALPLRPAVGVTARREGDDIVVRWRTAAPARRQFFVVAGQVREDRLEPGALGALKFLPGRGRSSFSIRLRPASDRIPFVAVVSFSADSDSERHTVVRVR